MKFNYQEELYLSADLKKVKYDGTFYKIKSIKLIESDLLSPCMHTCVDDRKYSIEFDRYIEYQGVIYYVSFCNKCKTLFLKPMS